MAGKHTPGPEGVTSLRELGLDHFYDEADWEATYEAADIYMAGEWIDERCLTDEPLAICTLIKGPTLFAAQVPTEVDEDGDVLDYELRLFATAEDAAAAIAKAKGEEGEASNG